MKSVLWILGGLVALKYLSSHTVAVTSSPALPETATPDNVPARPAPMVVGIRTNPGPFPISTPSGPAMVPPFWGPPPIQGGTLAVSAYQLTAPMLGDRAMSNVIDCRQAASTYPFCQPVAVDPLIGY
jgi:hypothetical protein